MKSLPSISVLLAATATAQMSQFQNVTVPTTCTGKFMAGTDEVLYTVPYNYNQVMSIIGSYKNLSWSGNPDDTVTLNGTDNTVGTARAYTLMGLHVIETILKYSKPPAPGPYDEVHNTATLKSGPVEVYIPYDGTTVTEYCDGKASQFNFTANFCSNNVTAAAELLHTVHLQDAVTVGEYLGGEKFTSCDDLGVMGASEPPMASSSMAAGGMGANQTGAGGPSASIVPATGAAATSSAGWSGAITIVAAVALVML